MVLIGPRHWSQKWLQCPLKDGVFKDIHMLGPVPEQQWPLPSSLTPNGSYRLKPPPLIYSSQPTQWPLKPCKCGLFAKRKVHEPDSGPPTLLRSDNTLGGYSSQIRRGLSYGGVRDLFYHLFKIPFGAISGVAQLDAVHVFGVCLQCVFHTTSPATQMQTISNNLSPLCLPPDSIMSFINLYLFHKRTRMRGIHVCLSAGMWRMD